ncbi:uncharacterized, partial [Tachysurus ichikawai]
SLQLWCRRRGSGEDKEGRDGAVVRCVFTGSLKAIVNLPETAALQRITHKPLRQLSQNKKEKEVEVRNELKVPAIRRTSYGKYHHEEVQKKNT